MPGDLGNPQSLNRYSYVQNDPVNAVDPLGLVVPSPDWYISAQYTYSGAWAWGLVQSLLQSGAAVICQQCQPGGRVIVSNNVILQWQVALSHTGALMPDGSGGWVQVDDPNTWTFSAAWRPVGTVMDFGLLGPLGAVAAFVRYPQMNGAAQAAKQLAQGIPKVSPPPDVVETPSEAPTLEGLLGEEGLLWKALLDSFGADVVIIVDPKAMCQEADPVTRANLQFCKQYGAEY